MGLCVVVGVGPGIGGALVRRFAADGHTVAAVSRTPEGGDRAYVCDVRDVDAVRATFERIRTELGPIQTLLWNVGSGVFGTIDQVDADALDLAYETNTRGLFAAVKAVLPDLRAGGGNVVITGATASRRGRPFTTAFAQGKAGQRALAESLARQLWPEGVHVALIVVDGVVDLPSTRQRMTDKPDAFFVSPDAVADAAAFLCRQDRRGWTFELEVRPHGENW